MNAPRTVRRTSEELLAALHASEARFHAMVDRSADGVLVVGLDGTIRFVNPAAETILGRRAGELLGEPYGVPIVPGAVAELDVLERGAPVRVVEMRIAESQWQDSRAYLATLRDITDHKRREEQCREAIRRRDEFLAMLSHELRNPLAAITNAAQVLCRAELSDPLAGRARDVIARESRQMARLIDDLLDVCRVSCGKTVLRKETVDMTALAAAAAELAGPLMDQRGLQFAVDVPGRPLCVDGDPVRLQQVAANLLANAAKYTPRGGLVCLTLAADDAWVELGVEDSGVGISAQHLPLIFEPFFQGQVTLDRSESGLGVGLALVRGLVQLHGGEATAQSDGPGRGSTFVVRLPRLAQPARSTPIASAPTAPAHHLRVLIVEDTPSVREMLKTVLELEGYEVETADEGNRGLEMIEFQRPDVALVDIGLPGIDGYELARRVRRNPQYDGIYLIALTGYGLPEDAAQALEAGFDVHLVKPLDPRLLATILSRRHHAPARPPGVSLEAPAA